MPLPPDLEGLVQSWLSQDQDPTTISALTQLIDQDATASIRSCMTPRIAFGTAGLRASMGPGFARMNCLTVIQTSQGLASYILAQQDGTVSATGEPRKLRVVIGRDARYNSEKFARLAAAAFAHAGFEIVFLDMCHTPLVPFAVTRLNACAGVVVTASHNPKDDNGYKVYWNNGCQIVPPHDKGIAAAILENLHVKVWNETGFRNALSKAEIASLRTEYHNVVKQATQLDNPTSVPSFTYTPMHGAGLDVFSRHVQELGLEDRMHVVKVQASPDPAFPTVKFPNPEEKGALDQAIRTANLEGDSLILANDPDADRFCVAEKVDGLWRQLSGNQIGVLLASHILETLPPKKDPSEPVRYAMLASAVTSRMLARMAEVDSTFVFFETLTGFKWLGNKARDLDQEGYQTIFAYEEALGYMLPSVVCDKDGIGAAAMFLTACQRWQTQGLTPWTKLQALYRKYGYFEEANTYLRTPASETTNNVFAAIRKMAPTRVGQRKIARWIDLTTGYDSGSVDHVAELPIDPSAQMITCQLEDHVRFTARGSGTEPKIKLYIEAMAGDRATARRAADSVLKDLLTEWLKPEQNGLTLP